MKVFISWSGDTSKQVASILKEWLKQVIQAVDPWMSTEDIDKGSRWGVEIAGELDNTAIGIICVTRENQQRTWLNFEAGALSKAVGDNKARVIPFLTDLSNADLEGPLSQFQTVLPNKPDVLRLLAALNQGLDAPLSSEVLQSTFNMWWPELETQLSGVDAPKPTGPVRTDREILEDILDDVRVLKNQPSSRRDFAHPPPNVYSGARLTVSVADDQNHTPLDARRILDAFLARVLTIAPDLYLINRTVNSIVLSAKGDLDAAASPDLIQAGMDAVQESGYDSHPVRVGWRHQA